MIVPVPVLEVNNLKVYFPTKRKHFFEVHSHIHAVDGVSLKVEFGKTLGLVGESGSGKTTTGLAIARLVQASSGSVKIMGKEVLGLEGEELRVQRKHIQYVFQDPYSSLNPRLRAGRLVREALDRLKIGHTTERSIRVNELFRQVGLSREHERLFPHQFSGGQRQRLGIARALASHPDLLICDEPVSALDVAVQAQILNLLRRLQKEMGLTYLFISHDLGVVQHMCDEIAVMYVGQIVEQADRISLFKNPMHPYTKGLLASVPSADPNRRKKTQIQIYGEPPSPIDPPLGCRFSSRCQLAEERCHFETPLLRKIKANQKVACHLI
ncbi:MAG: peptide ABC transporter ATP-binding protein [Deltaproteobacteria bacterium]|nr:peptide ABC transporter ATP-binding protein [Deltaproteobacteria bacterium]|tara:strand:+ start:372 stop:1346 length:975 start_codon:yes stop_codon:yes gene_type:complete